MPELHLTVDTQIVMIGNGMSDIVRLPAHIKLIGHFHDVVFLALDAGGQIRAEYERKMGAESEGRKWLANLAVHDRIRIFDLAKLSKKIRVELDDEHFDNDDRKFVRLAMATESKVLVAEEDDYSKSVRKMLKKHAEVVVHNAESACEWIAANRTPDSPDS